MGKIGHWEQQRQLLSVAPAQAAAAGLVGTSVRPCGSAELCGVIGMPGGRSGALQAQVR